MLTLTEKEYEKQLCRVREVFRSNVVKLVERYEIGSATPNNAEESWFYLYILNQWEQDKFESRQYNNWTTPEIMQKVYTRINRL